MDGWISMISQQDFDYIIVIENLLYWLRIKFIRILQKYSSDFCPQVFCNTWKFLSLPEPLRTNQAKYERWLSHMITRKSFWAFWFLHYTEDQSIWSNVAHLIQKSSVSLAKKSFVIASTKRIWPHCCKLDSFYCLSRDKHCKTKNEQKSRERGKNEFNPG